MPAAVLHVTTNLRKENGSAAVVADVAAVLEHAGARPLVWRVQECETWGHVSALLDAAAKHGLSIYWPGGVPAAGKKPDWPNATPILWTTARFAKGKTHRQLVHEGEAGVSGTKYACAVELVDLELDRRLGALVGHPVAQAHTSHPERLPKWRLMIAALRELGLELAKTNDLVVGGADLNADRYAIAGARMLYPAAGTYEGRFYDALWLVGPLAAKAPASPVGRLALRSDHDGVLAPITLTPKETPVVKPLRVDGADVSHYQDLSAADFAAFAKAGGKFVIQKATEALTMQDASLPAHRKGILAAGLTFGAYHFARPAKSSGKAQADYFLRYATPAYKDLVALDLEDDGGKSRAELTRWVRDFVLEVLKQTGIRPLIYTPFDLDDAFGCQLWVARYSNTNAAPRIPAPWDHAVIRQFSNGKFGVPSSAAGLGHVDLNNLPGGKLTGLLVPKPAGPIKVPAPPAAPAAADEAHLAAWMKAQVGVHEGKSGGHWNNLQKYAAIAGHANGQAWCATFMSAGAKATGLGDLFPNSASCDVSGAWFKKRGLWSEYPAVGAQVFYGTPGDLNHTGFVVRYDADFIYTIEGNTNVNGSREGDGVYEKKRRRRDAYVIGYGLPKYAEGITSADPARGKK